MISILSALGWVVFYWLCWVVLAFVAMAFVAMIGLMLLGDDVTDSEPNVEK